MKRAITTICLSLAVLVVFSGGDVDAQRRRGEAPPAAKITGMKILPYNRMSDSFGEDILESEQGGFNELDLSFLVKVEVTGKAGEFSARQVIVTVVEGGKQILLRNQMLGIYNENGKYFAIAWIYGPLCSSTTITARLTGPGPVSTIKKKIEFQCGE